MSRMCRTRGIQDIFTPAERYLLSPKQAGRRLMSCSVFDLHRKDITRKMYGERNATMRNYSVKNCIMCNLVFMPLKLYVCAFKLLLNATIFVYEFGQRFFIY